MRKSVMRAFPVFVVGLELMGSTLAGSIACAAGTNPLAGLLWKARPLVVVTDQTDDPRFQKQIVALTTREHTLADYDIKVVKLTGDSAFMRQKLGLPATGFSVVLVGKDGGV